MGLASQGGWVGLSVLLGVSMGIVRAAIFLLMCLVVYQPRAQDAVNEEAAVAALRGFFDALSVENYPNPRMNQFITHDFLIFEMGAAFDWSRFEAFLDDAGYENWISTEWRFSEMRVSLGDDSAHISYKNTGEFVYPHPDEPGQALIERNVWLESAYLVTEAGALKLKFLQSDNISREVASLP